MFAIGALFGSFFSLATYRLPRHEDIVATRSYCPNCKHRLEFFDLIPVLSYLIRGAKCKYCNDKISMRYFLLELTNGILFVLLYLLLGYTVKLLIVSLVYVVSFVLIGSKIMKSKMTEEKNTVVNIDFDKKLSSKKGVFISELVVAMIMFTLLLSSSYIVSKNHNKKGAILIARSNAISLAVKNIEMALATDYDKLNSFEHTEEISKISYNVSTNISKYSDTDFSKQDIVKMVDVNVNYMVSGKPYEFTLHTLKGKVL